MTSIAFWILFRKAASASGRAAGPWPNTAASIRIATPLISPRTRATRSTSIAGCTAEPRLFPRRAGPFRRLISRRSSHSSLARSLAVLLDDGKQSTLVKFRMSNLQLFRISTPFIALGVLLLFLLQAGHYAAGTPRFDPLAYIERGDQVTARYDAYNKALARYYAALLAAVKEHAPDLLANLHPREPILQGYQILPRIVPDAPTETRDSVSPVAYSWP